MAAPAWSPGVVLSRLASHSFEGSSCGYLFVIYDLFIVAMLSGQTSGGLTSGN